MSLPTFSLFAAMIFPVLVCAGIVLIVSLLFPAYLHFTGRKIGGQTVKVLTTGALLCVLGWCAAWCLGHVRPWRLHPDSSGGFETVIASDLVFVVGAVLVAYANISLWAARKRHTQS